MPWSAFSRMIFRALDPTSGVLAGKTLEPLNRSFNIPSHLNKRVTIFIV